jgi:hypothetical protein
LRARATRIIFMHLGALDSRAFLACSNHLPLILPDLHP